jgi:hypothetical protein
MSRVKATRLLLIISLLVAFFLPSASVSAASRPPARGIHVERVGHPTWAPVDFHLFSAPIGTAASGYAEFGATMEAILPPPNHLPNPYLGIGPGAPHPPPYTHEIADNLVRLGYHQGNLFRSSEFSYGMGVWLVWMNIPTPGVTGSSPDFASGKIIPNSLFPTHDQGQTYRNGKLFNPNLGSFDVPPLDASIGFNVDGHSHIPIFYAENADFGPPGTKMNGAYELRISILDVNGNGYNIQADFTVTS